MHMFLTWGTSWRWVVSFTPRSLHPQKKEPPVHIGQEVGWAPESVWTTWKERNFAPTGIRDSDPSAVQPLASRYTNCETLIYKEL
jgi:hypothetical protein